MFGDIFGNNETWKEMPFYIQRNNIDELDKDLEFLIQVLEKRTGTTKYTELFSFCFNVLVDNPEFYDGSSGDKELNIIKKQIGGVDVILYYDINSMIHDVLDSIGFTHNKHNMRLSDKLFDMMNIDMEVSVYNLYKRRIVAFNFVSEIRLLIRKLRKTKIEQKTPDSIRSIILNLTSGYKINFLKLNIFFATSILIITSLISFLW